MRDLLKENVSAMEVGIRFMLGAALLAAAMFDTAAAAWVALLSIYPVITAIMAWDPLYAVVGKLADKSSAMHKSPAVPAG